MVSEQRNSISSAAYRKFSRTHGRLSRNLIILLISLVLAFDLLSVYAKHFMGSPLTGGSVISTGMVMALIIVLVILGGALYYVRRINSAWRDMHESPADD